MNYRLIALTTLLTTVGLSVPVTAQIRNPSQDFFEQGWEQLEREIEILQQQSLNSEQSSQAPEDESLLEVSPSLSSDSNQNPYEDETPGEQPNEVDNTES